MHEWVSCDGTLLAILPACVVYKACQDGQCFRLVLLQVDNLQRRARVRNYPRLYRLQGVIPLPAAGQDAVAAQGQDGGGDDGADAPDMWHLQQLARTAPDLELALPRWVQFPAQL